MLFRETIVVYQENYWNIQIHSVGMMQSFNAHIVISALEVNRLVIYDMIFHTTFLP
jgi:hypothetical protein